MSNRSGDGSTALIGILVLLLAGLSGPAQGYEEVEVADGGEVTGRVILDGPPPPARIYHLIFSPNIDFCQRISDGKGNRLLQEFRVAPDGGFADVVVAVVGVERGKSFTYAPELVIENCRISPFVTAVRNGRPLSIVSHDPVTHDIQAYTIKDPYTYAMFNQPMPANSEAVDTVRLRSGHYLFRTQCGVHDFMQSWGLAVGNPYFAVTGAEGTYVVRDLPPGTYDIIAWHPHMAIQARRVTVAARGRAVVDFAFDAEDVAIPPHDLQLSYRLQTWLQPDQLVPPIVELQTR